MAFRPVKFGPVNLQKYCNKIKFPYRFFIQKRVKPPVYPYRRPAVSGFVNFAVSILNQYS